MIRPGRKVNPPAITRAPVNNISIAMRCCAMSCRRACITASGNVTKTRMDSKWIGLHGPRSRIVWMNNELTATVSISMTHDQPIRRCGIVPFGAVS
jgi:hypothetical protein